MSAAESATTAEHVASEIPASRPLRQREQALLTLADWRRRWPLVFTTPVPLAVGIARQVREQLGPEGLRRKELGIAIHHWSMSSGYLRAMARGEMRRNLDGTEAGIPDDASRQQARELMAEREARQKARTAKKQDKAQARAVASGSPPEAGSHAGMP